MDQVAAGDRWIPSEEYDRICTLVPIVCVDILPLVAGSDRFLLIDRDTYDGGHGLCLVGGSVLIDEPLIDAVERHVRVTLGSAVDLDRGSLALVGVCQYYRQFRPGELHDPRKNAVALTYTGVVAGDPEPLGEANSVHSFRVEAPPALDNFGFGQGSVTYQALATLAAREAG